MSIPLLHVEHLVWRYIGSARSALDDINFDLSAGQVLGVTGPSGAGKTTLTLALNGLIPQNFRGDFSGEVLVRGKSTQSTSVANLVQEVGLVFQDPETQFMGLSVEEEIVFALENLGLSDQEISARVQDALAVVHMEDLLQRSPFDLSGGQKQKVAIASALALRPSILVLDEPTSELDPIGAEQVFAVIHELKAQRDIGIIVVSHATEELAAFCDRVLLLHEGKQICLRNTLDFFSDVALSERYGVQSPQVVELAAKLGAANLSHFPLTLEQAAELFAQGAR